MDNFNRGFPRINPNTFLDEMKRDVEEKQRQEAQYKSDVLSTLQKIEKNTADLQSIVALLQSSNQKQEEIFEAVVEIMSISKAVTPEEADSKYQGALEKIQTVNDTVETTSKLWGLANLIWTMAKEGFKNPPM